MAKIQIKSEKLTPLGGKFSGYGAISFVSELVKSPKQRIVLIDNSVPRLYHQQTSRDEEASILCPFQSEQENCN